jgi:tetratricopeptide (TPR) repeat protein
MELPDPDALPSLEDLANIESVALFFQAARQSIPAFQLDATNVRAIAEICVRLDGLPLAIELAAARVRMFADPNVLLERLTDRLPLLNLGHRNAPARQQTMRDTIRWSYDLLDEESQNRFRRLSAFAGGFTEDAAVSVLKPSEEFTIPVIDGLDVLVDASLVSVDPGWDGNPRFSMLQTIREFGNEQLDAHGERAAAERSVAEYFRGRTHALSAKFRSIPNRDWMDELESEIENLRFALTFAQESGDSQLLVRLVWHLWRFWDVRGFVSEGRAWLDVALAQYEELDDFIRHDVAAGAAILARRQQDHSKASMLWNQILEEQRANNDVEVLVGTLLELSILAENLSDLEQSVAYLDEAKERSTASGYRLGVLSANVGLGVLEVNRQRLREGIDILEPACNELRELGENGDEAALRSGLSSIGRAAQGLGDLDAAIAATTECLTLEDKISDTRGRVKTLVSLARMFSLKGLVDEAEVRRREALDVATRLESPTSIAEAKLEIGRYNHSLPETERQRLLLESLQLFHGLDELWGVAEALEGLAFFDTTAAPSRAVTTYGAVDRLRATIPFPLLGGDLTRRQQRIAFLRELLGDEVFDQAWNAGQSQSLAETVKQTLKRS